MSLSALYVGIGIIMSLVPIENLEKGRTIFPMKFCPLIFWRLLRDFSSLSSYSPLHIRKSKPTGQACAIQKPWFWQRSESLHTAAQDLFSAPTSAWKSGFGTCSADWISQINSMTCIQESIRKIPCWQTEFKPSPLGAIHVMYRQIPA